VDELISRMSERLASRRSRRGFIVTVGKLALGVAGAATGVGVAKSAFADALGCCFGAPGCASASCPAGTHVGPYTWLCCPSGDCFKGRCYDCYDNSSGTLTCVYMVHTTLASCICIPG
jgi:hypothetical protein